MTVVELRAGFRLQLLQFRGSLGNIAILVAAPFYVLIFYSVVRDAGRVDLDTHAVLAPCLASMWTLALALASGIAVQDKRLGTVEPLVVTPASSFLVLLGRTAAIGLLTLVCAAETFGVAVLALGMRVQIAHPMLFAVAMAATCVAAAGTATVWSVLFLMGRSVGSLQNYLNYPFYVLGGVFVPVALLPGWLHPVSDAVFLSWGADLLRDAAGSTRPEAYFWRLGAILALGGAGVLVARVLHWAVLRRLRRTGELGW